MGTQYLFNTLTIFPETFRRYLIPVVSFCYPTLLLIKNYKLCDENYFISLHYVQCMLNFYVILFVGGNVVGCVCGVVG